LFSLLFGQALQPPHEPMKFGKWIVIKRYRLRSCLNFILKASPMA
jgi:hypothetical protein